MLNKLIESVLKVPGLVVIILIAVIGLGIYRYQQMPVDAFPDISPIMVPVFVEGHGMAPEEIPNFVNDQNLCNSGLHTRHIRLKL